LALIKKIKIKEKYMTCKTTFETLLLAFFMFMIGFLVGFVMNLKKEASDISEYQIGECYSSSDVSPFQGSKMEDRYCVLDIKDGWIKFDTYKRAENTEGKLYDYISNTGNIYSSSVKYGEYPFRGYMNLIKVDKPLPDLRPVLEVGKWYVSTDNYTSKKKEYILPIEINKKSNKVRYMYSELRTDPDLGTFWNGTYEMSGTTPIDYLREKVRYTTEKELKAMPTYPVSMLIIGKGFGLIFPKCKDIYPCIPE